MIEDFIRLLKSNVEAFTDVDLNANTDFLSLDCWDSIALLSTIIAIESEYEAGLSNDDIVNCSSIADLYELILKKKAEKEIS